MMEECSVTVLVLVFNPDIKKLISTIKSIICQKSIDFEIVFADDGSSVNYLDEVKLLFECGRFDNYRYIGSNKNTGTIKNILRGLEVSSGRYVYAISPGDLLYDENVLANLYKFANTNNIDFCFGKAIYYSNNCNGIKLYNLTYPLYDDVYRIENYNIDQAFISFMGSNYICGASYFRKKITFIKYLKMIEHDVKYVEDMGTSMVSFAEGNPIILYDDYVCWYEYGTGISTATNSNKSIKLSKDKDSLLKKLKELYPNNKIIDSRIGNRFLRIIKHPIISVLYKMERLKKKNYNDTNVINHDTLYRMLNE